MLLLLPLTALAVPPGVPEVDEAPLLVEVREAPGSAPSCARVVHPLTSAGLPTRRADDLALDTPGLQMVDLMGHGAPRASSWRGFSASYGADAQVTVDDVPVGHAGHPGGEGWATLGWVPRLLVSTVDVCGGVTDGGVGPRSTAGSVHYTLGLPREGWFTGVNAGTDSSGQIGVAFRPKGWSDGTFVVVEAEDGAGVGTDRGWNDVRVVAGIERNLREIHVAATLAFHAGGWEVPPRLSVADVASGELGFRESYRLWEGRAVAQQARLSLSLSRPWRWGGLLVTGWFDAQRFALSDNLTGFLTNPIDGDGQLRDTQSYDSGVRARMRLERWLLGARSSLEAGAEVRGTSGRTATQPVDLETKPLADAVAIQRGWLDVGLWAQGRLSIFERAELAASFRADHHTVSRAEDLEGGRSDVGGLWTLQPRVVLSARPGQVAELWAAWSRGNRPPLADDLLRPELTAPVVDTVEGGIGLIFLPRVEARLSFFGAFGRDEVVLDPLTGFDLGRGNTRRLGGTAVLTVRPLAGMRVRLDGAFADSRWDTGEALPFASRGRVALGVYADERKVGPVLLTGGLRFAWFPPRPTIDPVVAGGIATLDLRARVAYKKWWFDLAVDNLAPWDWWAVETQGVVRWDPEAELPTEPVRLGVPGRPFALVIGVGRWF